MTKFKKKRETYTLLPSNFASPLFSPPRHSKKLYLMEFSSPVFWVGSQVPCLQMTIYFGSSDYPKVINFCGIFFCVAIWRSEKMQFCKINFCNWSKSDRRKLMVVSLIIIAKMHAYDQWRI